MEKGLIIALLLIEGFTLLVQKSACDRVLHPRKVNIVLVTGTWMLFYILSNVVTYLPGASALTNVFAFFSLFLIAIHVLYGDSIKAKIVVSAGMYIVGMLSEVLVFFLIGCFGIDAQATLVSGESQLFCAIISKLIWFMLIKASLLVWRRHSDNRVSWTDWCEVLLVPVSSIVIAASMIVNDTNNFAWLKLFAGVMIVAVNLFTYYLYYRVQENAMNQAEKKFVQQQAAYYVHSNKEISDYWLEIRRFRHDQKQRYMLEQSYLQDKEYDKLNQFYSQNIGALSNDIVISRTGNRLLDNILNYKAAVAHSKGITFDAKLRMAYDVDTEDAIICSLLGNLIDNAIEAVSGIEDKEIERVISLIIKISFNNLYVNISNPYAGEHIRDGNDFRTTKEDAGEHGIGLKIVQNIVKNYNGIMKVKDSNGVFKVEVLVYDVFYGV